MRQRAPSIVLAVALVALAVWRAACVLAGPDIDTDAYAHHMIARAILSDPFDLAVHWVWLPLFHYLQVPLVALGGTMGVVRWVNIVLAAALPVAVYAYVCRTTTLFGVRAPNNNPRAAPNNNPGAGHLWPPQATALFAALLAAACTISMQIGTTAQPEPLFALLVFGVATAFQFRHDVTAAVLLGAAVLLRYEAWAALAAVVAIAVAERWPHARGDLPSGAVAGAPDRRSRTWLVALFPASLILAWAALRRPVDGQWFGFLRQTQEFAISAIPRTSKLGGHLAGLLSDLLYYPLAVPLRVIGPALALVPFGIARTVREQGNRFTLILVACLGFVSLAWARRSTLGLDRHFVVVVPLYAIAAAQGLATLVDGTATLGRRLATETRAIVAARALGSVFGAASLAGLAMMLFVWMGFWRASIRRGWPERQAIAAFLRSLPQSSTLFCDEATVEILSGLDRHRFDRHWVDDPHTWELIVADARERGVAYVATWNRKLVGHESAGTVVLRAGQVDGQPDSGFSVMRIATDESRTAR
ncbi:MAG TPA: hypothetical protein VGY54_16995 [Polyangiaceae bacterium]|jgi:hypothetical protein|nr:hypothetical protein [Polyangiaceae bacterium]